MSDKKTAADARKLRLSKALKANIARRKQAAEQPEQAPPPAKSTARKPAD